MSNGTPTTTTTTPVVLDYMTGMPPVRHSRSKELLYDSLMYSPVFILNPFGPQQLNLSRPNHHW
jgi:hypothetical protein